MKHTQVIRLLSKLYSSIIDSDISTPEEDAAVKYAIIVLTKLEKEHYGQTT